MKRVIFFVLLGVFLFTGNALSTIYYENFDDNMLNPEWYSTGNFDISSGILQVTNTNYSEVALYKDDGEFIYHFEADIMIPNFDSDQLAGIVLQWYEDDWSGYAIHLKANPWDGLFHASLAEISMAMPNFIHSSTQLDDQGLSSASLNEWYSLSITLGSTDVTIGINGTETILFDGLYQSPSSTLNQSTGCVHGHIPSTPPIGQLDYFTDNLKAVSAPVPEPATMLLFGIGLLGLAGVSRKKIA